MVIRIHRLLSKIGYLRCKHITLSEFSIMSGVPRSTLTKLASGKDVNISVRTLDKIVSAGFFEIRRVLYDRDRLSDTKLREEVFTELIGQAPTILATKRQANEASKTAIEEFLTLSLPEEGDFED